MDAVRSVNGSPEPDGSGGEWNCVKKGKGKKKKMKNARTLSLQTFFSEHGEPSPPPPTEAASPNTVLTPEESLAKESLLTYFADLVKRNAGPVKLDALKSHLDSAADADSLKNLILSHDQLPRFLSQSPDLFIVDDVVCDRKYLQKAKTLALEKIFHNLNSLSDNQRGPAATPAAPAVAKQPPPPPPGNVWMKGPPGVAVSTAATDPYKVDSLFNGNHHTGFGGIPLPDLSSPPPPLPRPRSAADDVEALNRSLSRVTMYNTELLDQLKEQEKRNQAYQRKIQVLERQLTEATEEIRQLKSLTASQEESLALKKDLESERLTSRSLREQHLSMVHSATSSPPCSSPSPAYGSFGGGGGDSFGLRGLLANATSPHNTYHRANGSSSYGITAKSLFGSPLSGSDRFEQEDMYKTFAKRRQDL